MRAYKDMEEAVKENIRDLLVRGITTETKSYQDKKLTGKDRFVKELIGVSFRIDKPLLKRKEALQYIFKDEADKIEKYCIQEVKDRVSGKQLNPGNSYKIRADMWNKFLEGNNKFSYTYSERYWNHDQLNTVIKTLKGDKGTRQAVLMVWDQNIDMDSKKVGGGNRIPCSLGYQFLIRNDRLYCIYNMRSNDFLGHHVIDLWCTAELMKWMVEKLKPTYKDLRIGSLIYQAGSLHAFQWDIKKFVVF